MKHYTLVQSCEVCWQAGDDFGRDDFGPNLGTILASTISAGTISRDDFGQDDSDPYRSIYIA